MLSDLNPVNRCWEWEDPLGLNPKRRGRVSTWNQQTAPSDPFKVHSWGSTFENIRGLKKFQLELETVARKQPELDAIVEQAPDWQFPLGDGHHLVLDQSKTTRTGWVGHWFGEIPWWLRNPC